MGTELISAGQVARVWEWIGGGLSGSTVSLVLWINSKELYYRHAGVWELIGGGVIGSTVSLVLWINSKELYYRHVG